jgi:hypothetical protein
MAKLSSILGSAFDSSTVEPQAPRGAVLPAGLHPVEITNAEVKELKSGKGTGLTLEYTVLDGPHAKRKVWQLLCIAHENDQTQQIAQSQLSALCRVVGINGVLDDTDMLFQKMLSIRTKVRPARGDFDEQAEVTGYEPVGAASAAPAAPAPAVGKAPAPWARKAA